MTDSRSGAGGRHRLGRRAPAVDRRQFVFGGALLAALATGAALRPKRMVDEVPDGAIDAAIPHKIGQYVYTSASGLVVPPQDELSARIYDQVVTRTYIAGDDVPPVMLLIAYGGIQDSGLALHRPESCYPAAGYSILRSEHVPVSGLKPGVAEATYLEARRGDRDEQVYYWTRIGDRFPPTVMAEKIDIMMSNLRGALPDGVLIRISVLTTDRAAALAQIQDFNAMLVASLGAAGRRYLLGQTR